MIETYAFEWSNTDLGTGASGTSLVWTGSFWEGDGVVMVPDGEGGEVPCEFHIVMACDEGPRSFVVTVEGVSGGDTSTYCNPLFLALGNYPIGCIELIGCTVAA